MTPGEKKNIAMRLAAMRVIIYNLENELVCENPVWTEEGDKLKRAVRKYMPDHYDQEER